MKMGNENNSMQVKALKLKDREFKSWTSRIEGRWDYEDFLESEVWKKTESVLTAFFLVNKMIASTAELPLSIEICSMLMTEMRKNFISLKYQRIADVFDAKLASCGQGSLSLGRQMNPIHIRDY